MKKVKSMQKIIREIKDKLHDDWVKNPEASKKSLMGSVEYLNRKYGKKSKQKKAA